MANIGYATLSVIPSAQGFGKALAGQVDPQLDSTASVSGARFGRLLGSAAVAAAGLALAGITAVVRTGLQEAMDASAGVAQLEAGIKSTGNAANVSVEGMTDLASSIQLMSGQTDDSIVAAEQLLLTFTNIKNTDTASIFDEATLATANMAAKMGGDASSNALLLGKALNDPINGLGSLTRAGVQFTDDQKAVIEGLVATGDVAGAQSIILAEDTQFGGAAEAAGKSLPGQLEIAKRKFEDISQTIAEQLLPTVLPALLSIADTVTEKILPAVSGFIQQFRDGVGPGGEFRDMLETVGGVLLAVVGFVRENINWLGPLAIAIGVVTAAVWLVNIAMAANPVSLIIIGIAALAAAFLWAYDNVSWFKTGVDAIGDAFVWLWDKILKPYITIFIAYWKFLWENVFRPVVNFMVGYIQWIGEAYTWLWNSVIKPVVDFIVAYFQVMGAAWAWLWNSVIKPVVDFIVAYVRFLGDVFSWLWTNAISPAIDAIGAAIGWLKDQWTQRFEAIRGVVQVAADFIWGRFESVQAGFQTVVDFFRDAPTKISGYFTSIGDGIKNAFKSAFNAVAGFWNSTIGGLKFTFPDWIPSLGGKTISMPNIPLLDKGGLVTSPTLAMIGERRPEVVIPLAELDKYTGGGKGQTVNIYGIQGIEQIVAELPRLQYRGAA